MIIILIHILLFMLSNDFKSLPRSTFYIQFSIILNTSSEGTTNVLYGVCFKRLAYNITQKTNS